MPEKVMWVKWDDGAQLSKSRKSPGKYSPLTRDAEKRLGHVVLSDVDEADAPKPDPDYSDLDLPSLSHTEVRSTSLSDAVTEVAAEVLKEVLEAAIDAARPHVARWWNDQARPAIWSAAKATRNRFRRATNAQGNAGVVPSKVPSTRQSPQGFQTEPADGTVMTMREAERRLAAALVARAFSDEQVRMILNSRVVDDAGQDVHLSLQEVPREEIEAQVSQLLEDNRFMLGRLMGLLAETPPDNEFSLPRPSPHE